MKNKRGMSAVITTLIIILLTIVALGIVWVVVKNVISSSSKQVNLRGLGKGLEIQKALASEDGNSLYVTVYRNPGEGNITAVNFVIGDGDNSVVVERQTDIPELGTRTFAFDLSSGDLSTLGNITSISVAPVYTLSTGQESKGDIMDTTTFVGTGTINGAGGAGGNGGEAPPCSPNQTCSTKGYTCGNFTDDCGVVQDCGTCDAGFYCADNQSCIDDTCVADNDSTTCLTQSAECGTVTGNCGQIVDCNSVYGNCSVQYNESYSCTDGTCVLQCTDTCTTLGYECGTHIICGNSTDCEQEVGCNSTYECVAGNDTCQPKTYENAGTIDWCGPPGVNKYFSSPSLPKEDDLYRNHIVTFPNMANPDCYSIFLYTYDPSVYNESLVELNLVNNISDVHVGDPYEIWESQTLCQNSLT